MTSFDIDTDHMNMLVQGLLDAATRYSASKPQAMRRLMLWSSPFTQAIAALLFACSHPNHPAPRGIEAAISDVGPLIILFHCSNLPAGRGIKQLRRIVLKYAIDIISAQLDDLSQSASSQDEVWDAACDRMITASSREFLDRHINAFPVLASCPKLISAAIFAEVVDQKSGVTQTLLRWAVRLNGIDFVSAVVHFVTKHLSTLVEKEAAGTLNMDDPPYGTDIIRHLGRFNLPQDKATRLEKCRVLVLELAKLVICLGQANRSSSHARPTWHEDTQSDAYCNLFCFYSTAIIASLRHLESVEVVPELSEANLICSDDSTAPIWTDLRRVLRQTTVRNISIQLSHRTDGAKVTTPEHRQDVKTKLLNAFKPFFTPHQHGMPIFT